VGITNARQRGRGATDYFRVVLSNSPTGSAKAGKEICSTRKNRYEGGIVLKALSLFSGIGGLDIAAHTAGIETVGFCEIEPFACRILNKRFPEIPVFDDVRKITKEVIEQVIKKNDKYKNARNLYNMGHSIQEVADMYGITRQGMWDILKRRGTEFRDNKRFGDENHFYRGGSKASDYAQNKIEKAILYGKMERKQSCEKCGSSGFFKDGRSMIQAHHPNYNKPLEVMWLCQKCHHEWHKNNTPKEHEEVVPDGSYVPTIDVVHGGFPQ
jgi:predicted DNA-binding protein YlxM (UPF0122 family)